MCPPKVQAHSLTFSFCQGGSLFAASVSLTFSKTNFPCNKDGAEWASVPRILGQQQKMEFFHCLYLYAYLLIMATGCSYPIYGQCHKNILYKYICLSKRNESVEAKVKGNIIIGGVLFSF